MGFKSSVEGHSSYDVVLHIPYHGAWGLNSGSTFISSTLMVAGDGSSLRVPVTQVGDPDRVPGISLAQPWLVWALEE